jgi:putative acetyltransferase
MPPSGLTIRPERPGDAAAIHAIHSAAFDTPAEAKLVDRLRASGRLSVSLVAELAGKPVGHIAFSPVTLQHASGGVGLAPVSVVPELQRAGVGGALVQEGLAACRRAGYKFAVVLGWPEYYPRFGFEIASRRLLANEYGADETFMALELTEGAIPAAGGLVRYAPEFAVFE